MRLSIRKSTVILLMAIALALPIIIEFRFGEGVRFYNIPVGGVFCTIIGLFYFLLLNKEPYSRLSGFVHACIVALIAVGFFSVFVGILYNGDPSGLFSFIYQLILLSFFYLGFLLLRTSEDLLIFFRGIVITAGIFSILLIFYILQAGLYDDIHALHNDIYLMRNFFGWPNAYGCFLVVVLMFNLSLLSFIRPRKSKLLYRVFGVVFIIGILLTFSRSAYLVALLAILTWIFKQSGKMKKVLTLGLAAIIGAVALSLFPELSEHLLYSRTAEVRFLYLETIINNVEIMGIMGVLIGYGYQSTYVITSKYSSEDIIAGLSYEEMSTHNEYLTMMLKSGLFALILFCLILIAVAWNTYKVSKKHPNPAVRNIFTHWLCVLVPLLLSLFVMENLRYWPIAITFWMLAGSLLNYPLKFSQPVRKIIFKNQLLPVYDRKTTRHT